MAQKKRIKKLIQSLLEDVSDEQFLKMLDSCTKLTITLKIVRGHAEVTRESSYKLSNQKGHWLAKPTPINQAAWKKIFSL